ncbi:uncharacterized protein EURHEDRAFT_408216 [Aspergillus ruber CBS 135680]|uniref:Secreted protein n=1 Tax=Aspergillus ruber (strain CBS 135680) TaxID=1388766 RepID=A0A017SRT6_ASPRC|nr:uncharacterized protein EURHEDRAFT_408216 [Aspergillus ruber CBS 135680]EYE98985.1 hypothetical protein EURHEDRAFT_408216 [Aspergillus ruber CBS 135680]
MSACLGRVSLVSLIPWFAAASVPSFISLGHGFSWFHGYGHILSQINVCNYFIRIYPQPACRGELTGSRDLRGDL